MATNIEWCDETWNPIIARVRPDAAQIARDKGYASLVNIAEKQAGKRGHHCEHAHRGCENCYAEAMNGRCLPSWGTGLPYDRRSRDLLTFEIHEETLLQPLKWKRGRHIFPCSMTDLFGEWVTDEYIDRVFAVMALCPQHRFICLTKRPERLVGWLSKRPVRWAEHGMQRTMPGYVCRQLISQLYGTGLANRNWVEGHWPLPNVILGTSASDQGTYDAAAPDMRALAAAGWNTVWSLEPLLGEIRILPWDGRFRPAEPRPSWVIVGGESGHGARPCSIEWIRSIVRQCKAAGVPCFVKQVGAKPWGPCGSNERGSCDTGTCFELTLRDRKGGDITEWPKDIQVREMPEVLR